MSTATQSSEKKQKNGTTTPTSDESRFTEIATDLPMYVPVENGPPLVGYLLYVRDMPPDKEGRAWQTLVVRTTRATTVTNVDDETYEVPAGSEVLVGATAKLREALCTRIHADFIYEVFIKPLRKISIGAGKTMWTFKVGVDQATVKPRPKIYALTAPVAPKALSANGSELGDGHVDSEIPF